MTRPAFGLNWLLIITAFQAPTKAAPVVQTENTVVREIRFEGARLRVYDKITMHDYFAMRDPNVNSIFVDAQRGKTNLIRHVKALLQGESLEVEDYRATTHGDVVDLEIRSAVVFHESPKPAKLRWVPFLGGQKFSFPAGSIGRTGVGVEIQVFENSNKLVLWFPELGAAEKLLSTIDEYRELSDFAFQTDDFNYNCNLRSQDTVQALFSWIPSLKVTDTPDSASLKRLSQQHAMSLNDVYTLFTNFKVAKPGYYRILPSSARSLNR
jgi:hypothetical protein